MTDPPHVHRLVPRTRFEGLVPKQFVACNIMRFERVEGARAVVHTEWDRSVSHRYAIESGIIARPERGPEQQFLVVGTGCRITFESDADEVFVAGVVVEGPGGLVAARSCIGLPVPDATPPTPTPDPSSSP